MNNPKVKFLLLISLLAGLGAVISVVAAGSHFQLGFTDGAFNFDFKVATGDSRAASVLGLIALAAGLVGVGLHVSRGNRAGGETAFGCGDRGSSRLTQMTGVLHRLAKSKTDVWLGGVCGGLGQHTPLPSWVWRLGFLLLLCWYGTGALLYGLLWICLPEPLTEGERPGTPAGTAGCATG